LTWDEAYELAHTICNSENYPKMTVAASTESQKACCEVVNVDHGRYGSVSCCKSQ